jgi:N-acetylmuramoyl-L-alanine amidase
MTLQYFSEKEILARTLYGEARGEVYKNGIKSLRAIAHVIINRYKQKTWYGKDIKEICLKPFQFSCWNKKDPNYPLLSQHKIMDGIFLQCEKIAHEFVEQKEFLKEDFTKGSTHYHHHLITPIWSQKTTPIFSIGNHVFYKL